MMRAFWLPSGVKRRVVTYMLDIAAQGLPRGAQIDVTEQPNN
jgi:hypothetical protein